MQQASSVFGVELLSNTASRIPMNHHEFTIPNQSALSIPFHSLVGGLEHFLFSIS